MLRIGVVGATGYTGLECCRLLSSHPKVNLIHLFSHNNAGVRYSDIYPQFRGVLDQTLLRFDPENVPDCDCLFLAVPHGLSHEYMGILNRYSHMKIIDLSADFRLEDASVFESYYNATHKSPELLSKVPYGLPELNKEIIKEANIVANPGCYATSVILGLFPLLHKNMSEGQIIADCKSGISGAGRKLKETSLFCEGSESFSAYSTGSHRHSAEIEMALSHPVLFSPHLVPMSRGILSSMYVTLKSGFGKSDVEEAFEHVYADAPFVRIVRDKNPDTKHVKGSNFCVITLSFLESSNQLVVFSALDNLVKGAAGQAVQNMNIMVGYDETEGLQNVALYL